MPQIANHTAYPAIPIFWSGTHAKKSKPVWTDDDVRTIFSATVKRNDAFTPFVGDHTHNDLPIIGVSEQGSFQLLRNKAKDRLEIWTTPATFSQEALDAYKQAGFKRPSVNLRDDLSIKNVALVQNPAITDIPEITFSADPDDTAPTKVVQPDEDFNSEYYTFGDWRMPKVGRILNNLRDYLVETIGKEKTDAIISRDELANLDGYEPEVPEWVSTDISRLYTKIWDIEEKLPSPPIEPSLIFSQTDTDMNNPNTGAAPQNGSAPNAASAQAEPREHLFSAEDMQRALREQEAKLNAENAATAERLAALERKARLQEVELAFSADDLRERVTPALRPMATRLLLNDYNAKGELSFSADDGKSITASREADIRSLLAQLPRLNTRESAATGVHQFSADEDKELENLAKQTSGRG